MKDYIEERAVELAYYIIETKSTVRQTARCFGISKSTVHKDITERLEEINPSLASETRKVLDVNKAERHIRGGLATKEKYLHQHISFPPEMYAYSASPAIPNPFPSPEKHTEAHEYANPPIPV